MARTLTIRLLFGWLFGSLIICALVQQQGFSSVSQQLDEQITHHLLLSLDNALFSNSAGSVNDSESISYVGGQINAALWGIVQQRWLSTLKSCQVGLLSIDGVNIPFKGAVDSHLDLILPRNQIDRVVRLGLSCEQRWQPYLCVTVLLGLLFALVRYLLPLPMSAVQQLWVSELLSSGYDRDRANALVAEVEPGDLHLNPNQKQCFEILHLPDQANFQRAIALASDERIRALDANVLPWLLRGLRNTPEDLGAALDLASCPARVVIDLVNNRLSIHGVDIPLAKTPLFYYAWYAGKCLSADGWMTNPQSNRPDRDQGLELSELMFKHGGHAKAISDLEEVGLKAKTLDQNRSKLKEEFINVLGEELAEGYLFEHEKDAQTGRMRYRLKLQPDQIELIV